NMNMTDTHVSISNTAADAMLAGLGSGPMPSDNVDMKLTGPDSNNQVRFSNSQDVNVSNDNYVDVENVNLQSAQSGNVSAYKNTTVGGLSSGNASNSHTNSTSVHISN